MKKKASNKGYAAAIGFVLIIVISILVGLYLYSALNGTTTGPNVTETSSSTTASSGILGIVTGYVIAGPSQPVCAANQSCDENMSGYNLVFTLQCSEKSNCQTSMAELSPSGHYSILLPPGNYSVTGLYPSCNWMGCSFAFPNIVVVEAGMQLVFNIDIDTGIR